MSTKQPCPHAQQTGPHSHSPAYRLPLHSDAATSYISHFATIISNFGMFVSNFATIIPNFATFITPGCHEAANSLIMERKQTPAGKRACTCQKPCTAALPAPKAHRHVKNVLRTRLRPHHHYPEHTGTSHKAASCGTPWPHGRCKEARQHFHHSQEQEGEGKDAVRRTGRCITVHIQIIRQSECTM